MTTITIVVEDDGSGAFTMVGNVDDPSAFQREPTPALIFGSYLAAHAEQLAQGAWAWYRDGVKRVVQESQEPNE